jgi:hypothetical protein
MVNNVVTSHYLCENLEKNVEFSCSDTQLSCMLKMKTYHSQHSAVIYCSDSPLKIAEYVLFETEHVSLARLLNFIKTHAILPHVVSSSFFFFAQMS